MAPTSARIASIERRKIEKKTKKESKDYCLISYDKMRKSNMKSVSVPARKFPEPKPGWPLLCKSVAAKTESLNDSEARKMSVVQWVMSLPDRSSPPAKSQVNLIEELERILALNSSTCKFFQYEELQNSTNYFSQGPIFAP